jgi:hypothetical protein
MAQVLYYLLTSSRPFGPACRACLSLGPACRAESSGLPLGVDLSDLPSADLSGPPAGPSG